MIKNKITDRKKEKVPKKEKKSGIMALDPSGTSTSSIFYYQNWNKYQFYNFTDKNWLKQAQQMEIWLKKLNPKTLLVESGVLFAPRRYNYNMVDLIRTVGALEYQAQKKGTEYVRVSNDYRQKWANESAEKGWIEGLKVKEKQGKLGRPKKVWIFKEKELNEHERDALLIFYAWWTKKNGWKWPFSSSK